MRLLSFWVNVYVGVSVLVMSVVFVLLIGMMQTAGRAQHGDMLGYVTSSDVYLMDVERRILVDTRVHHAAAGAGLWSPDLGRMAFVDSRQNNIVLIDIDARSTQRITNVEAQYFSAQWSPDGTRFGYVSDADGDFEIYIMDMSSGSVEQITHNDFPESGFLWLPDGRRITYGTLVEQDFVPVVRDLDMQTIELLPQNIEITFLPIWSPVRDSFAYVNVRGNRQEVYLIDTQTQLPRLLRPVDATYFQGMVWSPDGRYLTTQMDGDLYVLDAQTGERLDLQGSGAANHSPAWSPNGRRLAFVSNRDGNHDVYILDLASGTIMNVSNNIQFNVNPAWAR
jgi:TolB protein